MSTAEHITWQMISHKRSREENADRSFELVNNKMFKKKEINWFGGPL